MSMDEVPGRSRSVTATRSIFGESIGARRLEKGRAGNVQAPENLSPEMKQLATSDLDKLRERKAAVEKERAEAESELSRARSTARELERQIEQTKARAASKRSELSAMSENKNVADVSTTGSSQEERDAAEYAEVLRELDRAKRELLRLKAEVRSAAEAKAKAEGDIVASAIKIQSDLRTADEMKRLVEEANEEHVLVELARIEAERELRDIEAQRRAEAERFAREMEEANARVEALRKDVGRVRDMEAKLAVTNSDVAVLQAEMELVRAMERNSAKSTEKAEAEEESLRAAEAELEAAKKQLESIKAEGFQFMTSMDSTRTEIMRVAEEVNRLKAQEKQADAQVQELNAKLLKARARLEAATAAGERSTAIVSNLTSALQQLRSEAEAARKEKEVTEVEQRCVRAETENVGAEMAVTEAQISQSVKELEAAKASEAAAMRRLKAAVESTMHARASAASHGRGTITISQFEYEYLTGRAALVRVVADKKVAAAQAWVQALKASEKELAARAEAAEREAREMSEKEARAAEEAERAAAEHRALEQELYELNLAAERDGLLCTLPPRRPNTTRVSTTTTRRARARRSSVSSQTGARNARPPSFAVKRKRKVMPNLMKIIRERRAEGAS